MPKTEKSAKELKTENARQEKKPAPPVREIGGQKGPEPTRYGDWEKRTLHGFLKPFAKPSV